MKKIFLLGFILAGIGFTSCTKDETFEENLQPNAAVTRAVTENTDFVLKEKMVLGKRLENPYSVQSGDKSLLW